MIIKRTEERPGRMEKKSDGVKDVFKWLEKECKAQKKRLDSVKEEKKNGLYYWYPDMGESVIKEEEIRLETLVNVKISVEKYMKKLKHKEKEHGC